MLPSLLLGKTTFALESRPARDADSFNLPLAESDPFRAEQAAELDRAIVDRRDRQAGFAAGSSERSAPRAPRTSCVRRIALTLAAALATAGLPAAPAEERPNVVFILADDLGIADLGSYGGQVIPTPNLDRLSAEGLRFTQAYAGSTVCAPSRCALMTGQHTGHGQIRANLIAGEEGDLALIAGTTTVATEFKAAGYATGAFGKWGLGGPGSTGEPARMGFDEFFGYLGQRLAHEFYPTMLRRHSEAVPLDGRTYSHTAIFESGLDFIRANAREPFFLYLPVTLPHGKLDVPDASAFADRPWPQAVKNYAAMVALLDRDVGRLMALLRELDLDRRTLVIFSSDNGPEVYYFKPRMAGSDLVPDYIRALDSNGPFRGFKRDLYEGGIRVPLIFRWPGRIQPGVSDHLTASWDFLATFAELIGRPAPEGGDGISLVPTLLGRSGQRTHSHLYWEFHEGGFAQAVRFGSWKALRHGPDEPVEIYDLAADPGETRDLAAHHPEIVAKARTLFDCSRSPSDTSVPKATKAPGSGYARFN